MEGKKILAKIYKHVLIKVLSEAGIPDNFSFNVELDNHKFNLVHEYCFEHLGIIDSEDESVIDIRLLGHNISIKEKPEITEESIDLNE